MTEKQLEQKLKKEVEKLGGLCLKLKTPGFTGIPDRLVLLPGGKVWFVEVKKPGKGRLSERQKKVSKQLWDLSISCVAISGVDGLQTLLQIIKDES